MKNKKIIEHPDCPPKREGGWNIKTKDGRKFNDLTMEEAVDIHNDCLDAEEKTIQFKKEDE